MKVLSNDRLAVSGTWKRWLVLYVAFPAIVAVYNGIRGSVWIPEAALPKRVLLLLVSAYPIYWSAAAASYGLLRIIRPTKIRPVAALLGGAFVALVLAYYYFIVFITIAAPVFPGLEKGLSPDRTSLVGGFTGFFTGPSGLLFIPVWLMIHYVYERLTRDAVFFPGLSEEAPSDDADATVSAPLSIFLSRLPPHLGQKILAIEAQQHYVRVHTDRGNDLILYRFGDAVRELDALFDGMRVHRSYWVADDAISDIQRAGKSYVLQLANGLEVPVSLSYRGVVERHPRVRGVPA